jgi:hypothetical protein
MTYDAHEIQELKEDFRSARAEARKAQVVVTEAYASFLAGRGSGPSPEQLDHAHKTHMADDAACHKYVTRLEELSRDLTSKGTRLLRVLKADDAPDDPT